MHRLPHSFVGFLTVVAMWSLGEAAQAQVVTQPPPAPWPPPSVTYYPPPSPGGNLLQPYYIPPTNYSMTGPSTGTLGYTTTTSYFVRPGCSGDRFVPATTLVPVYGYTPGYYRGYATPLFFRY